MVVVVVVVASGLLGFVSLSIDPIGFITTVLCFQKRTWACWIRSAHCKCCDNASTRRRERERERGTSSLYRASAVSIDFVL